MFAGMKLGLNSPTRDSRIPHLSELMKKVTLPRAPTSADYLTRINDVGMLANDRWGCCVISACFHVRAQEQIYTLGSTTLPSDNTIAEAYQEVDPNFDPNDESTDTGLVIGDALQVWFNKGFAYSPTARDKIAGYCQLNPQSDIELNLATYLMGNVIFGVDLPLAWQTTTTWDVGPNLLGAWEPGSWGGHCVPSGAYDPRSRTIETWGTKVTVTRAAIHTYFSQAFTVLSPDWMTSRGISVSHYLWPQLTADMQQLKMSS